MGWDDAKAAADVDASAANETASNDAKTTRQRAKSKRFGGRRGRFNPAIEWEKGKELFVRGEVIRQHAGRPPKVVYPSFSEIGRRIGTTKQNVAKYASKHNWLEAREKFISRVDEKVDAVVAESRARLVSEPLAIVDDYINRFCQALQSGAVRIDAAADLDKMVRLRTFLTEKQRVAGDQKQVVSLEAMQRRHRRLRETLAKVAARDDVAGVLHERVPGEDDDDDEPMFKPEPEPEPDAEPDAALE